LVYVHDRPDFGIEPAVSASAVAALGESAADVAILDEASVVAGMSVVRDHRRALQANELALAASVA
jgi:hypothetical protein